MTVYWRQLLEYIWKKKEKEKKNDADDVACDLSTFESKMSNTEKKLFRRSFQSMFMVF